MRYDNVTVQLVKKIVQNIFAPPIAHLINLNFTTAAFPESLKRRIVILHLIKANITKIDNIDPISLLSILYKVFEKCMKIQVI